MTLAGATVQFRSHLRRFARQRDGVSAVEFAIVLPFMLLMYIGSVELGDGLAIKFKGHENRAHRYRSRLAIRQHPSLRHEHHSWRVIEVIAPYPSANMVVTVSEVTTNAKGQGTITWSCSLNGTARADRLVGHAAGQSANRQHFADLG